MFPHGNIHTPPVAAGARDFNPRSVCPDGHPPYDKLGLGGSIIVLLHGYRDSDELHPILAICVLSELSLQKRQHKANPLPLARFQETLPPAAAYRRMFVWTCFMKFSRSNLRFVMVFCFSIMSDAGDVRRPRLHPE